MREPESVEMVVPDLIEKGITTFLAGPGGTNKPRLWRVTPNVRFWLASEVSCAPKFFGRGKFWESQVFGREHKWGTARTR